MGRKPVLISVIAILLTSLLGVAFRVEKVQAVGTIYIRTDGSIDPPTALIVTLDNITYMLTGNINSDADGIVVERDNIVVVGAGHTIYGNEPHTWPPEIGINLSGRTNVTVQDVQIRNFGVGVMLKSSYNNSISGNNVRESLWFGIMLNSSCDYNSISGNNITANNPYGIGIVFESSTANNISRNRIANNQYGIILNSCNYNIISENIMTANYLTGIYLHLGISSNNTISNNNITESWYGVDTNRSTNNRIIGNNMTDNIHAVILWSSSSNNTISGNEFYKGGLFVQGGPHNTVVDNSVNGKPLVYLEGISNYTVDNAGQVILVDCANILVEGLNLSHTNVGVELFRTNNTEIAKNEILDNRYGVLLYDYSSGNGIYGNSIAAEVDGVYLSQSSNNSISGNNVTAYAGDGIDVRSSSNNTINDNAVSNSSEGIRLSFSLWNRIYHNNFFDNQKQASCTNSTDNVWDDGYPSGGNYWSDYTNADIWRGPYQNETGSDGVGDSPYTIDENNTDNYPLMSPRTPPDIAVTNVVSFIEIENIVILRTIFPTPPLTYCICVNVTFENQGSKVEGFNLTAHANATEITTQYIILSSNSSATVTFEWNTTGFANGFYVLSAYAWPIADELDAEDNMFVNGGVIFTISGDVDGDRDVDIFDIVAIATAYGSEVGEPAYEPNYDVDRDGDIDIFDIVVAASHYGESW